MSKPGRPIRTLLFPPHELARLHVKRALVPDQTEQAADVQAVRVQPEGLVPLFDINQVS